MPAFHASRFARWSGRSFIRISMFRSARAHASMSLPESREDVLADERVNGQPCVPRGASGDCAPRPVTTTNTSRALLTGMHAVLRSSGDGEAIIPPERSHTLSTRRSRVDWRVPAVAARRSGHGAPAGRLRPRQTRLRRVRRRREDSLRDARRGTARRDDPRLPRLLVHVAAPDGGARPTRSRSSRSISAATT